VEPFAAILIGHGAHVFWGTPKGQMAKIRGQRSTVGAGRFFGGEGSDPNPHQLGGLGTAVSSPSQVRGGAPTPTANKFILDLLRL